MLTQVWTEAYAPWPNTSPVRRYSSWNVLEAREVELAVFFFFLLLVLASSFRAVRAAIEIALSYSSAESGLGSLFSLIGWWADWTISSFIRWRSLSIIGIFVQSLGNITA